jgi:N-hydroxyarylamine O-acetyltransferase
LRVGLGSIAATSFRRASLHNNRLAIHALDGTTERRTLATVAEVCAVLEDLFWVKVPMTPELEMILQPLVTAEGERRAGA